MTPSSQLVSVLDRVPGCISRRLGSRSAVARLLRPAIDSLLPAGRTEVTIRSGVAAGARIEIEPRHEKYYWTGAYELGVQALLAACLQPGDVAWDVGAHVGFFTLVASRLVGPAGIVHAFEPQPENAMRLARTIELNGLTNVTVHRLAVSDAAGPVTISGESSTAAIAPVDAGTTAVDAVTLDCLLARLGAPAFVKLDVEGREHACLAGARELLAHGQVHLLVEVHDTALECPPGWISTAVDSGHVHIRRAEDA